MGNYDQLKNAVAAVIHDNGAEYITGDRLQDVLVTIINSVGAGATFAGVALPNTNPGTPDPKMFYLAGKAGTYTNFNVTITKGLWVFTNDGGTWTGTDLQVSMLFATGEDVTDTSITDDLTQGSPGSLPTTNAVRGALVAEDEKFLNEVAYEDIDDLATFDEAFAGSESGTPAYYTVYVMVNSHKVKVGTMEIVSDNMAHVVTQVMVTHYVLDENGAITGAHSDGDLFRIFRSKKIHGGTLPTDDWTPWAYVNETEWKKIVSGADAVPTPGSTNVVKSGGVAAAIFNEVAFEDLGNIKLYIDTLAGSQSGTPAYYTVYKAVGDDKVKVGTLQVISDSSRGVLTQILETHYTLDAGGVLTSVVDDDHTFRMARSVTYSGGMVSLWSPWSYVNGSIVEATIAKASEMLRNVNYLLAGCKGNVFDKNYVRAGKSISTNGSGANIIDVANSYILCYYKIPAEADMLHLSGGLGTGLLVRFSNAPSDDATQKYVVSYSGDGDIDITAVRTSHPDLTLEYITAIVCNGAGNESALDTFSLSFEDTAATAHAREIDEKAMLADALSKNDTGSVALSSTTEGYYYPASGPAVAANTYNIANYTITGAISTIYVQARIGNSAYIRFFDENDNILSVFKGNSVEGVNVFSYISIPDGCVKFGVSYVNAMPCVVLVENVGKRIAGINELCVRANEDIEELNDVIEGRSVNLTNTNDRHYYNIDGQIVENSSYAINNYEVFGDVSAVHILARIGASAYILFFDVEDNILASYPGASTSGIDPDVPNIDDDYTIPEGCVKFAVSYVRNVTLSVTTTDEVRGVLQRLETLENEVFSSELEGAKIGLIGDSIAANGGFIAKACQILGATFKNAAIGGWMLGDAETKGIYRQVNAVSPATTSLDGDEDLVIIFAGTNDYGHAFTIGDAYTEVTADGKTKKVPNADETTTCGGLVKAIQTLYDKYGGYIPIVVCLPLQRYASGADTPSGPWARNTAGKYIEDYAEGIRAVAALYGIPVIDFSIINMNPNIPAANTKYFQDGLHPNTAGHELMGRQLAKFLKENAFDV